MADKGKKKGKGGDKPAKKSDEAEAAKADSKASSSSPPEKVAEKKAETASAKKAHDEDHDHDHDDHDHAHDHAPAKHGGAHAIPHGHAPNRKEYVAVFGVLALLTALEVGVAKVPGIAHTMMVIALIGMALAKAATVAFYFMHLKHETRVLRLTVAIPLATPAIYALVLITEAAWRLTRS